MAIAPPVNINWHLLQHIYINARLWVLLDRNPTNEMVMNPSKIKNLSALFRKLNEGVSLAARLIFFLCALLDASRDIVRRSRNRSNESGITNAIVATHILVNSWLVDNEDRRSDFSRFDGNWSIIGSKEDTPHRKQNATWNSFDSRILPAYEYQLKSRLDIIFFRLRVVWRWSKSVLVRISLIWRSSTMIIKPSQLPRLPNGAVTHFSRR